MRAAVFEVGLLALGVTEYLLVLDINKADWELPFHASSAWKQLTFQAWKWDSNNFSTNFVTHLSGALYYMAARGSHLSILGSLGVAAATSTAWEIFGELREKTSINDVFYTPLAGAALGEAVTQMSGFLDAGSPHVTTQILATLFNPFKKLGDALDGARPVRNTQGDWLHDFRFTLAPGATVQRGVWSPELGFSASAMLMHFPRWNDGPAYHARYADGNVSQLGGQVIFFGGGLADVQLHARSYFAGTYDRVRRGGQSWSLLTGAGLGLDVMAHQWTRTRGGPWDQMGHAQIALTFQPVVRDRAVSARFSLDGGAGLGGVTSWSLRAGPPPAPVPEVIQLQGYYHAISASIAPGFEISMRSASAGARASSTVFFGAPGNMVGGQDSLTTLDAWLSRVEPAFLM